MNPPRKLPDSVVDDYVVKMMTINEISSIHKCSPITLRSKLVAHGVTPRKGRSPVLRKRETIDALIHDYTVNSLGLKEVCAKYKISPGTLRNLFKEEGVQLRLPGRNKRAVKREDNGFTASQIQSIERKSKRVKNIAERHLLHTDGGKQIYEMLKIPYQEAPDLAKHLEAAKTIAESYPQDVTGWKAILNIINKKEV